MRRVIEADAACRVTPTTSRSLFILKKNVPERNQDDILEMVLGTDRTSQNRQYHCQNYC